MGEIKISQLKGFLRTAAEQANINGDKKIKGDEEISTFIATADKLVEAGLVDKNYKETLGLTLNASSKGVTMPDNNFKVEKDEVKLETTKLNRQEKKLFKDVLDSVTSLDMVSTTLDERFTDAKYTKAKNVINMYIADIKAMNINSKEDVNKIVDLIDKKYDNCDGFNKDIAKKLANIVKYEQIKKEKDNLLNLYRDIKTQNPGKTYTGYVELVNAQMEAKGYKGSYYKNEAYNEFIAELKQEANSYLDANLRETNGNYGRTQGDTSKQVRKELQAAAGDDKFLKNVIKHDKTDNSLEARYNRFRAVTEVLKNTTSEMLNDELKDGVVAKLSASYINKFQKENGNYDLTELQAEIARLVGDDLLLNRSQDTEVAELKHVQDKLKELTGSDFSKKEVKDLIEFLGIGYEKRDKSAKTVLRNMIPGAASGALGGAIAGGIHATRLNITQRVELNLEGNQAEKLLEQLGPYASAVKNADGSFSVKVLQKVNIDKTLVSILAGAMEGAVAGALLNALATMITGEDKAFEKSCFSMTYLTDLVNSGKDLSEIQDEICKKYPGMKGTILAALAENAYNKAEGKDEWKLNYLGKLSEIAGVGSNPNCEELQGNKFTKPEVETVNPTEEDTHVYDTRETAEVAPVYEDVPTIDAKRSSWAKLSEQYDCLDEINTKDYPLCTKNRAKLPIRMLKIAQAITDGNYSQERMLQLAEMTFASPNTKYENLKSIEGIDHAVLVNIMNANWLSDSVKMPKTLAGCNRDDSISIIAPRATERGGNRAPVRSAGDRTQTSAGQNARYYASFDTGAWQEYPSAKVRDEAVSEFKKKYPNATVSKKND